MTCEKFPPKCLHCELPGHVIDDCPGAETILCFNCQKYGHTQSKCPKLQKKRKSDTTEEMVSADMLAEANKRTKIAHNSWLAKYGELEAKYGQLEAKFGISEGIIKGLRSEKEDVQGANDRLRQDLRGERLGNFNQAKRIESLSGDLLVLDMRLRDLTRENENFKKQIRAVKASVQKSLRAIESGLGDYDRPESSFPTAINLE